MDGIGGEGDGLLLYLNTVDLVVVVEGDLLSGGHRLDVNRNPAVVDVHITQVDDFIPLRHIGQRRGVDLGGVGRDGNLALAGLVVVHDVPIVDADIPLNKNGNLTVLDG